MSDLPARPILELTIPLAIAAALFIHDEQTMMFAFGVIGAAALAFAAARAPRTWPAAAAMTTAGVVLALHDVRDARGLVVLAGALAVLTATGDWSPLSIAAAIAVAIVTPMDPTKAILFPFVVAALDCGGRAAAFKTVLPVLSLLSMALIPFVRYSYAPMLVVAAFVFALPLLRRVPVIPQAAAIALFALWPWSGLLARSFPAFLRSVPPGPQRGVGMALRAAESVSLGVPAGTRSVVITASGARMSRMRRGAVVGRFGNRDVRIGDIADFGFMRREQFFSSRNAPPREPADDIRASGSRAWLYGAGRVTVHLPRGATSVKVTAASDLPRDARLQIESIEIE